MRLLASTRNLTTSLSLLLFRSTRTTALATFTHIGIAFYPVKMEETGGRALSSGSKPITSAEELRRKRLAALTGERSIDTTAASSTNEVVDLCDSSDDDEELLKQFYQQKKQRTQKNAENQRPGKESKSAASLKSTEKAAKESVTKKAASMKQASPSTNNIGTCFQVATWNVWFGPQNLPAGEPHGSARMKALAHHLLNAHNSDDNPLWAIGFQEVIDELAVHLFPLLERAGYQVFRQPGAPYGCAIALYTRGNNSCTLLDASWQPYLETAMARGFLYARFQLPFSGQQLLFCTTHLESWTGEEYTGSQQRVRQLKELEAFCNDQIKTYSSLKTCIITGDMNWDDERPRSNGLDPIMANVLTNTWQDSWLTTRRGRDAGYTYDSKLNPMLGGSLRRRFDRCLVRNTGDANVVSTGAQLVGTEALVSLTWQKYNSYTKTYKESQTAPSDHFGLIVQMTT